MLIPFLDLIFLKKESEYAAYYEGGAQAIAFSTESLIGNFNYHLSAFIIEAKNIQEGKFEALVFLCIIIGILFFFKNLFGYLALYSMAKVRNGVLKELRENTFRKILYLPLSYYSEEKKGDIISKLSNDVLEIEWSVLLGIELIFRDPLNIILLLTAMVYMSPQLTVFVFVLLPITGIVIGKVGHSLRETSEKGQAMSGVIMSILEETLSGLRIIKAFNAEKKTFGKYHKHNTDYFNLMVKVYRKRDLASPLSEFLGIIILIIILWFGGKIVLEGDMSASVFITFVLVFSQIIAPAKSLSKAWYNVQRGAASADRLGEIINAPVKIKDADNAENAKPFSRAISIKDVWFKYDKDFVLKGINLEIKKGETIALVGASGGGKSTLTDLLPRFHDTAKGEILIDGKSIKNLTINSVRDQLGVVTQQSILFNDSIFNNIAFGVENATQADVENAARIANAHDFISAFPDGYNSNIGDGGSKLSGGQKQRISIARAVLKNPPILILDEATSALDTESERLVQDALNNLMKNRTSLVVAHRLSTIINATKIVVIENGEIIEMGTHADLIEQKGNYYRLSQLQSFK
tara:strand:+ start:1106 stop:2842 length:1737 start_codon:yes stop_codon:yes gene_type:complete